MSKGSGGTRTVSSAKAAASRTFAQSAIGGGSKIKDSMATDFEASLKEILDSQKEEMGAAAYYSMNDHVSLSEVQAALDTALNDIGGEITMTMPTNNSIKFFKGGTNSFEVKYKGNTIKIEKFQDNDSSRFSYSINGGTKFNLAKDEFGGFAGSGDFKEGMKNLLNKMKKM